MYNALAARGGPSSKHSSGRPVCKNCGKSGHWEKDCYSQGGGAEGQDPRQRHQRGKDGRKDKSSSRGKEKETKKSDGKTIRANQATTRESTDSGSSSEEEGHSSYMAKTSSARSHFAWILDGGTTTHITNDRSAFIDFEHVTGEVNSLNGEGPTVPILGQGSVHLLCSVAGRADRVVTLWKVKFCPTARDNLISESCMDRRGLAILKQDGKVTVTKKSGEIALEGSLRRGLYELHCILAPPSLVPSEISFLAHASDSSMDLLHCHLAHLGEDNICYLVKHQLVTGLNFKVAGKLGPCDGCAKGKHPQAPFPSQATRASTILERLHMDL